ncbi:hypothetical protein ACJJH9_10660 [Microbulbifer sp. DLAB2-AF]|uniref:hypothetical protein n=1 Tax=Microbulbifer sp. DLAB2-AF TaxID=3243395 RepID=UPI004039C3CB
MRVDFLALRKGETPLIAGLLMGRQEEMTWWRGREAREAVCSANSVYAAFRDERSPNIPLQKLRICDAVLLSVGTYQYLSSSSTLRLVLPCTGAVGFHGRVGRHPWVSFKLGGKVCVIVSSSVARLLAATLLLYFVDQVKVSSCLLVASSVAGIIYRAGRKF